MNISQPKVSKITKPLYPENSREGDAFQTALKGAILFMEFAPNQQGLEMVVSKPDRDLRINVSFNANGLAESIPRADYYLQRLGDHFTGLMSNWYGYLIRKN